MSIHISRGNMKLGKDIYNISLPPGETCESSVPCRNSLCYAHKAWRLYPSVRHAWGSNLAEYVMDPKGYFGQIADYLIEECKRREPQYTPSRLRFRWHVGGDIPNQDYLDGMIRVARWFPNIRFLAFTKRYRLEYNDLPGNLSIVISAWPGYGIVQVHDHQRILPTAWCQDGTETRIPKDATECPGSCAACDTCWGLGAAGHDVWFHKH